MPIKEDVQNWPDMPSLSLGLGWHRLKTKDPPQSSAAATPQQICPLFPPDIIIEKNTTHQATNYGVKPTHQTGNTSRSQINGQSDPVSPFRSRIASSPSNQTTYKIGQEVHLLDSSGTEPTGLTTYTIIDTAPTIAPTTNLSTDELHTIYILKPTTTATFRTTQARILPVGFSLGAEVQQYNNICPAIVIRRTVAGGQRTYDLRDELGIEWRAVPEAELTEHKGGDFSFQWIQ